MSADQLRAAIDVVIGDIEDELAGISPPVGSAWHQLLLEQMAVPSSCRPRLFSEEVMSKLRIYLGFRHMVRHNYSNRLKEDRVKELHLGLSDLWILVKADLESFKNN